MDSNFNVNGWDLLKVKSRKNLTQIRIRGKDLSAVTFAFYFSGSGRTKTDHFCSVLFNAISNKINLYVV